MLSSYYLVAQTDRHTKDLKTVYPPVSLCSLGGYKNRRLKYIRIGGV